MNTDAGRVAAAVRIDLVHVFRLGGDLEKGCWPPLTHQGATNVHATMHRMLMVDRIPGLLCLMYLYVVARMQMSSLDVGDSEGLQ
jgi:hypothetical protein